MSRREPLRASTAELEAFYRAKAKKVLQPVVARIARNPRSWLRHPTYTGAGDMVQDNSVAGRLIRMAERVAQVAAQQARILLLASGMDVATMARMLSLPIGELRSIDVAPTLKQRAILETWAREGVGRIVAIPASKTVGLERTVQEWVRSGGRVEDLTKLLDKRMNIGLRHARVIARDQTAKLSSRIDHDLMQSAGVDRYIWRTVRDQRVRDEHQHLEGKVFAMGGPGAAGAGVRGEHAHPGEAIQCRCYREPIV